MIVYFDNKSGKIYGVTMGRVHTKEELKTSVLPSGIDKKDISKKVFTLEETKEIEKEKFKVIQKEVVLKNGKFDSFTDASKIESKKPDSVETIFIDLNKSINEINSDLSKTTRNYIKQAKGMTFREIGFNERSVVLSVIEEIEDMKDIKLAKYILQIRAPFLDGLRRMYVVENESKEPLAVALITCFNGKFIYSLGGVTSKGRGTHAGDFLIWELIKDAKDLGYKFFDLGGIYADWADDKKKKVNIFKERWGGKREKVTSFMLK